jgi:hypothetical protein
MLESLFSDYFLRPVVDMESLLVLGLNSFFGLYDSWYGAKKSDYGARLNLRLCMPPIIGCEFLRTCVRKF